MPNEITDAAAAQREGQQDARHHARPDRQSRRGPHRRGARGARRPGRRGRDRGHDREPRSGRGVGCPGDPCRQTSRRVSPRRRAGRPHAPVCVPARSAPVLAQIRLVRPLVSPAARPGPLPLCFPACGCPSSVRTPQPRTRRRYRCPTRPSRSPRPRRSALSTPIATSPSPSPMPSNG